MDLARLGIHVSSESVPVATRQLNRFSAEGRQAAQANKKLETSTNSLGAAYSRAAAGIAAAAGVIATLGAALRASQQYTQMTNGLRAMGQSADQAAASLDAVAGIANRTRAPLQATAELYRRISTASADLGASQSDVLKFTENVGLALAASGTSANEASGALLQLSQAMAGGVVRAEEFNSILEGAFPIAQAAARGIDEAGGSVGRLRQLVVDGKISSDEFFNAIISQTDQLQEAFANTVPTIGQAMSVLNNSFTVFSGKMDAALGVSSKIAEAILFLAENIDRLAIYAATAAAAFGGAYVAAMVVAAAKTLTLAGALKVLRTALIRTGIGALVVGAGELIYQFSRLVKATGSFGGAMSLLGEVAAAVWQGIIESATAIPPALNGVWELMKAGFFDALSKMATAFFNFFWTVSTSLSNVPGFETLSSALMGVADSANVASGSLMEASTSAKAAADGAFSSAGKTIKDAFGPARDAVSKLNKVVEDAADEFDGATDATDQFNDALDKTGGAGGKAAKGLEKAKTEAEAFEKALKDAADTAEELGQEKASIVVRGVDGIADAFGNFIAGGLRNFKDFAKSIIGSFQNMLAEMISLAVRNKLIIPITASLTGGAAGTAAQAAGGGGGILNGLGGLLKGGSIFGKTGIFGSIGSSLGTSIGSILGGQGSALATSLGSLGASIGAVLPVIGIAAAAFSFLKSKTVELDRGIRVTTTGMDALVETFRTVEKTKFWGLSKKVRTNYEIAAADVADPIQQSINRIGETVMGLADTIGLASENLQNTRFEFEVTTKDKTDAEIQEAIAKEMERLGNTFADAVIGSYVEYLPDEAEIARLNDRIAGTFNLGGRGGADWGEQRRRSLETERQAAQTAIEVVHLNKAFADLQLEGEGSLDTLSRVVSELQGVNGMLRLFDRAMLDMSASGAAAASKLVQLSGGLEAFSAKTQYVFDNFLTDAGRNARLTEIALEELNRTFGDLQFAVPETHDQFMALLDAQDLTTAAGRETYAALVDVAGAFVQVNGTAQGAANALEAAAAAAQAAQEAQDRALRGARSEEVQAAQDVLDARAEEARAADIAQADRVRAAAEALQQAEAALRSSFQAEQSRLSAAYDAQIEAARAAGDAARAMADASLDTAQDRLRLRESIADALEGAYRDRRVLDALGAINRVEAGTAFLRAAVRSGGTSDLAGLEAALDAVSDPATALYGSFTDYQQDFNVNTNLISNLKDISDDQLSTERLMVRALENAVEAIERASDSEIRTLEMNRDAELSALDRQMGALLNINGSVRSVGAAIATLKAAQDAVDAASPPVAAPTPTPDPTPQLPPSQFQPGSFGAQLDEIYQRELGRGVRQEGLDWYGTHYVDYGWSISEIEAQIAASPEAQLYRETGVPKYDVGTNFHPGGLAYVHKDEMISLPRGSAVSTVRETRAMMDNSRSEALLQEISDRLRYIQDKEKTTARILTDWNVNGQPGTRPGDVVMVQGTGDQGQIKTEEVV